MTQTADSDPVTDAPIPTRIQRLRTRGWRKPTGAIYVGRPTKWGNPFRVVQAPGGGPWEVRCGLPHCDDTWVGERDTKIAAVAAAVDMFAAALRLGALLVAVEDVRRELAGRDLACWCPLDGPCHGDVLLAVANGAAL